MNTQKNFTPSQQKVIDLRKQNMLVSASAGTGKTTVMIERIAKLIEEGCDVTEMVVVTFTNLAAAEMKARLAQKLSEKRGNERVAEQLENLDSANICTLHSFCNTLLRNYFYVVDIDPSFTVLDTITAATLKSNAMDEVFEQYFSQRDEVFNEVYKIFSVKRQEENFRKTLYEIYDFSRCLENFGEWYAQTRKNFETYSDDNPIVTTLLKDIGQTADFYEQSLRAIAQRARDENIPYANVFDVNADKFRNIPRDNLDSAFNALRTFTFQSLPPKKKNVELDAYEEKVKEDYKELREDARDKFFGKYNTFSRGLPLKDLWDEMGRSLVHVDKLTEIVERFDAVFWEEKKRRGGLDFNDLEHLTLKLLNDPETLADIRSRYKLIFVDEYQDTNPVQEAIVSRLAQNNDLFCVGDVKQSIYGFRGCEPAIFVEKYDRYKASGEGTVVELNDNFRSNSQILEFVNSVFDGIMTTDFGKVDYRNTARLRGTASPTLKTPSVKIDFLERSVAEKETVQDIYDIETATDTEGVSQAQHIVNRVKEYVGMAYRDKNGEVRRIGYGDVAILICAMKDRAVDIYNALVDNSIPVSASFKVEGYTNKEVRDVVNLLRVLDNPYDDIPTVGACLTFGHMSEDELCTVRLHQNGRMSFIDRLQKYVASGEDRAIADKISKFLDYVEQLRFYSQTASVCDTVLKLITDTDYRLTVQSMPNGALRLNKLYAFANSLRGAYYAQSVDKFLSYVDDAEDTRAEEGQSAENAVRLMTMHASKGLEFPVVILAGLEARPKKTTPAVKTNAQLGMAIDRYDFFTMHSAQTLGVLACQTVNDIKQREENMRLLYVALTRAKFALNLVASVTPKQLTALPKQPNRATSHLDWILSAVRQNNYDATKGVEVNVYSDVEKVVQNEEKDVCEQTVGAEQLEEKLSFRYPYRSETKMPSKIVSSRLDRDMLEDNAQEPPALINDNSDLNEVGTAYHKVYQFVDYNAHRQQIVDTIAVLVESGRIEQRYADRLDVDLIYDTLHNRELVALLSRGKVYHEIPFMLYVPYNEVAKDGRFADKVMLQGVIDLLIVGEGRATVVDFKYTKHSDLVEERYAYQLNSYRTAVKNIFDIDDVECYVLSIADNRLIKMNELLK